MTDDKTKKPFHFAELDLMNDTHTKGCRVELLGFLVFTVVLESSEIAGVLSLHIGVGKLGFLIGFVG